MASWQNFPNMLRWLNIGATKKSILKSQEELVTFLDMAASRQFARPFGGSVRGFRQRPANWGSVLVPRFAASEGTVISAPPAILIRGVNVPAPAWDGRRCRLPALLCDPQRSLIPGNSWSQQSVHHFICGHQDEHLDSRWDPGDASVSSASVAVVTVRLFL